MSGFGSRPTAAPVPVDANRRALAEALLGFPARVGQAFTGMANAGLQANEAFLQGRGTDGEDLYARPFLPGADTGGRLGALASFIGSNMAMGGPAGSLGAGPSMPSKGIRAYHGSPHDFDRFDLSKIGTGEGAQAYGHGLYFAENEGVARAYRDALKRDARATSATDTFENLAIDGQPLGRQFDIDVSYVNDLKPLIAAGDQNAIKSFLAEKGKRWQDYTTDSSYPFPNYAANKSKAYEALIDRLNSGGKIEDLGAGRMYEVNINARPEQFLDWDAPLSAQPKPVQDAFGKIVDRDLSQDTGWANLTGEQALRAAVERGGSRGAGEAALREAGIPGIRYLDQGSRAAGDGSRNYVVFDDKLIDILRKYGLAGLTAGGVGMAADGEAQANPLAGALLGYQPQE